MRATYMFITYWVNRLSVYYCFALFSKVLSYSQIQKISPCPQSLPSSFSSVTTEVPSHPKMRNQAIETRSPFLIAGRGRIVENGLPSTLMSREYNKILGIIGIKADIPPLSSL
uniref:Uncharacterized protein n=1 Tax=Micrurus carvalhoi TaxID=3147026 RepID=A0A2H6N828_9SAUR